MNKWVPQDSVIAVSLEKIFFIIIIEFEERAATVLKKLDKFFLDHILPVNVLKTKVVLIYL